MNEVEPTAPFLPTHHRLLVLLFPPSTLQATAVTSLTSPFIQVPKGFFVATLRERKWPHLMARRNHLLPSSAPHTTPSHRGIPVEREKVLPSTQTSPLLLPRNACLAQSLFQSDFTTLMKTFPASPLPPHIQPPLHILV